MNLIQIANGMGDKLTFGDLPQYIYIIGKINQILNEDQAITVTTTGTDFLTIYETLKQSQQNTLASVIDTEYKLVAEIVTDLCFREMSERRRERQANQNNIKLFMFVISIVMIGNFYAAYSYHKLAAEKMGKNYKSALLATFVDGLTFYDKASKALEGVTPDEPTK
jgi:hypothetical protein